MRTDVGIRELPLSGVSKDMFGPSEEASHAWIGAYLPDNRERPPRHIRRHLSELVAGLERDTEALMLEPVTEWAEYLERHRRRECLRRLRGTSHLAFEQLSESTWLLTLTLASATRTQAVGTGPRSEVAESTRPPPCATRDVCVLLAAPRPGPLAGCASVAA